MENNEMYALMEIIVRTGYEMEIIMGKLQTEPSSKIIHGMQGENAGYKDLLSAISAEFKLPQSTIEYKGDNPVSMPDLDDIQLETMRNSVEELKADDRWAKVLGRLEEKTETMKTFLLFEASSASDLDIAQGKQRSFRSYESLFNAVDQEVRRRMAKAEEERQEPDLPFEDTEYEVVDDEERSLTVSGGRTFAVIGEEE